MVPDLTVERLEDGGWRLTWGAGDPPYAVWLDGILLTDTLLDLEYEVHRPGYETQAPALEVLSESEESESQRFPPYVVIQWRSVTGAIAYVVEEYVGGEWILVVTVMHSSLRGYYSWKSPALADGTTPTLRVKAVDLRGNAGDPLAFTFEVCRNPTPPTVSGALDNNGHVEVS